MHFSPPPLRTSSDFELMLSSKVRIYISLLFKPSHYLLLGATARGELKPPAQTLSISPYREQILWITHHVIRPSSLWSFYFPFTVQLSFHHPLWHSSSLYVT